MRAIDDAAVPHNTDCAGHHCAVCGCCLLYDPDDYDSRTLLGPDKQQRHTCYDCREPVDPRVKS